MYYNNNINNERCLVCDPPPLQLGALKMLAGPIDLLSPPILFTTCPSESNHTDECTQTRLLEILICTNSSCHILHNMGISSTMPHSDLSVIRVPKNTTPTLPTV